MSYLALRLIAENKASHERGEDSAIYLDLGKCGLTALPEELFELDWLEELIASNKWWDERKKQWVPSKNQGPQNRLTAIPDALGSLRRLKNLALGGDDLESWPIRNFKPLEKLSGLQSLDLSFTQISDFRPLEKLSGLQTLYLSSTQISDFRPLEKLSGLQSLDLSSTQISDLRPLEKLSGLQTLYLSSTQISDFRPLEKLSGLQSLYLSSTQISDLRPLEKLSGLQSLDLIRTQISDFRPLEKLSGLQSLYLISTQISDLRPLEKLSGLQTLNLSFTQISDFRPLEKLSGLQTLYLSSTQISDLRPLEKLSGLQTLYLSFTQISDFRPLEKLSGLQTLYLSSTQISDFRPLEKLSGLQTLNLSNTQISDLRPLEKLSGLQTLDLSFTQISDLRPLEKLSGLQSLDLSDNKISNFPKFFLKLPNLNRLYLRGNPIVDVAAEIINQGKWSNCLFDVKNYFHALSKGAMPNDEVKLLLLGNGRVGKTSIMRAMLDREFDENEESTEKVVLRVWALPDVKTGLLKGKPLQVNIWDFGGQEIYYTTHRLFLRTKALFLLVWDKETEESQTHEDGFGHIFENFKLLHWIDYIRTAHQELVIVVQNKVDHRKDKYTGFEELLQEHYDKIFDFQYVSAKKHHKKGLPALQDCIRDAYNEMPEVGQLIGQQWIVVRQRLSEVQRRRSISYSEYLDICLKEGLEGTEHETLINLLHNTGFLYFLKDIEEPKIILDQQWAIDAVYAVLKRSNRCYQELCRLNRHGFTLNDLDRLVWHDTYPLEEQKELLKFMVDTQTCFEFTEGVFIAPQLLSTNRPPQVNRRHEWREPQGPAVKFRYPFLHLAIIERFVVRAGRMVREEDPLIWRYGIAIYDETSKIDALVEAVPQAREIRILTHGDQPLRLIRKIMEELSDLHREYEPKILYSADGGTHFVLKEELEKFHQAKAEKVADETGEFIDLKPLLPFLDTEKKEIMGSEKMAMGLPEIKLKAKRMEPEKPVVKCFISYAHFYQDYFEVFWYDFEAVSASLKFCELDIWTDENIPIGVDWHKAIQKQVANCDIAILLVSDRFMTSKYIKYEEVARLFERKESQGTLIIPVYFYPCRFRDWTVLEKNQLFKPKGMNYGHADKDTKEGFCFADLVQLDNVRGKNIAQNNPDRSRYMMDFVEALEPRLKEIVARKY